MKSCASRPREEFRKNPQEIHKNHKECTKNQHLHAACAPAQRVKSRTATHADLEPGKDEHECTHCCFPACSVQQTADDFSRRDAPVASISEQQWRMNTGTQGRTFVFQLLEDAAGQPHAKRPQPPPPCEGRGLLLWTNTKAHQHQRKMIVNTTNSSASVARRPSGLMHVIVSQQHTG